MKAPKKAEKAAKKVQKQAPKKVQKQAPKKPAKQLKKGASKATRGWFGGAGGAQSLDKWYGRASVTLLISMAYCRELALSIMHDLSCNSATCHLSWTWMAAGPDRALFLPGGLLDPADVPSYLNGSLAGE